MDGILKEKTEETHTSRSTSLMTVKEKIFAGNEKKIYLESWASDFIQNKLNDRYRSKIYERFTMQINSI